MQKTVFLAFCDYWTIWWSECCRNDLVNVSDNQPMLAIATLNNVNGLCDISPRFVDSGVPHFCVNDPISYSPGASDPNGNTMVFSLISARMNPDASLLVPVPLAYTPGYSGTVPIPGITINPTSGQINFTATLTGNFVVVVQVATYTSGGVLIGTVMRDLMFVVMACDENSPVSPGFSNVPSGLLVGPNSIAACQGESFCVDLAFTDVNPSQVIAITSNAAALLPGATFVVNGTNPAVATLCWTGNTAILPVNVFVLATDGSCPIPNVTSRSIFLSDCILLPVALVGFNAKAEASYVIAEWATASEDDNDLFVIERSADGTDFEPIGTVDGIGESQQLHEYVFYDRAPLRGLSYYRLAQMDIDGTTTYSHIVPVIFGSGNTVRVQATERGWVVAGVSRGGEWQLVDMTGRVVAEGTAHDDGPLFIPPLSMSQGVLVLAIHSGQERHRIKLPPAGIPGTFAASGGSSF